MIRLEESNRLIEKFEEVLKNPLEAKGKTLYTGIDLGTAYIVLAVLDEKGEPVCGAYQPADVVKDGMVVDYMGAVKIVRKLKADLEEKIDQELYLAGVAIPPGTENIDGGVVKNVAEAAGFEVVKVLDEPTAANKVLKVQDGAVVDIGGGTTGISVIKNGEVVKVMDEASGGRHFSLVIAGAHKIPIEEAEKMKQDFKLHREIFPLVQPVVKKIISIIEKAVEGYDVDELVLVGGTALLTGIEGFVEKETGLKTSKPSNPMFVTPLGIAEALIEGEK